jgi:hypothetical protein
VGKEDKFPISLGKDVKFEHPFKPKAVEEYKFPTSSSKNAKLKHPLKSKEVKEDKFPTSFGILSNLE